MRFNRSARFPRRLWYPFALPRLDDCGGTQGQQTHHGADLEPPGTTIRQAKDVIVKSILLVPHAFGSRLVHSAGDPQEMVSKLYRHVLVERVAGRQLERDLEHVLREHGNPRGAVRLLKTATGGQRR